jgi:hypothetical protein
MAEGIQQFDPTEYPTRHAFRLVNDARTNLCIVGNKIEDDKLAEFEDEACEALIDLFDAMAEQRGLNEQQFEDVYLNQGLKVCFPVSRWNRGTDAHGDYGLCRPR